MLLLVPYPEYYDEDKDQLEEEQDEETGEQRTIELHFLVSG
jgi:hypothetical protein